VSKFDDEILESCLIECIESSEKASRLLLDLEIDPSDSSLISEIFRAAHSVKGSLSFFNYGNLVSYTHAAENLLNDIREGNLAANSAIISALLDFFDDLLAYLKELQDTKVETKEDLVPKIAKLTAAAEGSQSPIDQAPEKSVVDESQKQDKEQAPQNSSTMPQKTKPEKNNGSIRVDVRLLDKMMDLVGELVLSRNQVTQIVEQHQISVLSGACQYLNHVTSDLQDSMMETRMQPIIDIWRNFPRIVRDFCQSSGKRIEVTMQGEETELDKTLIEAIKDPLTHIVRNSMDHGIEMPDVREQAGKSPVGKFALNAYHQSGQVVIEIQDDGKGIDPEIVKNKALEKGLISVEQHDNMSDVEAVNLIFKPGFSTADSVTDLSGRGVGMDVVRTNVAKIKGYIDVESTVGQGTKFTIKIPLTLAIFPGLSIVTGDTRFIIPQSNLVEMIRHHDIKREEVFEYMYNTEVYRLRDELLRVVDLSQILKLNKDVEQKESDNINLIVVQANGKKFCLLVDRIEDSQEIVVKPLIYQLTNMSIYAGLNIMSDGSIVIILDLVGLANYLQITNSCEADLVKNIPNKNHDVRSLDEIEILTVESDESARFGIPVENLKRIERIPYAKIESSGKQLFLQYFDKIMPIWDLKSIIDSKNRQLNNQKNYFLVVIEYDGEWLGFMVDEVEDIQIIDKKTIKKSSRDEIQGVLVVKGKITEIVDINLLSSRCKDIILEER